MVREWFDNAACEQAIRDIASGDSGALAVLYDRLHRQIYAVSRAILQNHADAEDNLQNTLCEILKCASFFEKGNARAWVLAIARNQALHTIESRKRVTALTDHEDEISLSAAPDSPEDTVICMDALATLGKEEREIVVMKVYSGLKHKEIAKTLGISEDAAQKRYVRAIAKLKEYYTERGRNG